MRSGIPVPLKAIAAVAIMAVAFVIVLAGQSRMSRVFEARQPVPERSAPVALKSPVHAATSGLAIPVQGIAPSQLTDTFTDSRAEGRLHDAIDIMAARGTPVLAAAPGRVEKLFLSRDGGTTVYERSLDGSRIYYYAHLDAYAPGLREGMALRRGQAIGTVGSTGNANPEAPHLHFAVMATSPEAHWWDKAEPLNPYPLLTAR